MSNKNLPVSISVFPTLDFIELVQFNEKTGDIEKAAALPCSFDNTTRLMLDRDQLTQSVRDLYEVSRISFATPAILILPGFFTREIDLPAEFSRDELRFALVSEAERFYVFKKVEPQVDWLKLDQNKLLYSAYPKSEIEKYALIFHELRIPLLAIDVGYFSMIRGLLATGVLGMEHMNTGEQWCLLTISDNAMFSSIQRGLKIQKTIDVPLSVSQDGDHTALEEITQDFQTFVEEENLNRVCLVNNSHGIDSQELLLRLGQMRLGEITLIEQNAETLASRGGLNALYPCSLEAIGGVFHKRFPDLSGLNFLPDTGEDIASIAQYQKLAVKWLLVANAGVFVLCLFIWGILSLVNVQKQQEAIALANQTGSLGVASSPEHLQGIERKRFIKAVTDRNIETNNFLIKTGSALPADTWLEKLQITSEDLSQPWSIDMEGKAMQLDPVNRFLSELKPESPNVPLEVGSAAQATSTDGQTYFTWTIRNQQASTTPGSPAAPTGGGQ